MAGHWMPRQCLVSGEVAARSPSLARWKARALQRDPQKTGDPLAWPLGRSRHHQYGRLLRRDRPGLKQLAERRRDLRARGLHEDADTSEVQRGSAISLSVSVTAPPLVSRSVPRTSRIRMGWAMAVPSAMVGEITVSAASAASMNAAAIGAQLAGWAANIRGRHSICSARSNSEKPISQPSTFDPAPHGVMMLSGGRKPRSSHNS